MKHFITVALICFSFAGFAQTEKKVQKNDEKIDELNQRLDNLIGSSKEISGDSVEFKLDMLFREIQNLKTEMSSIRESVDEIKQNGVTSSNASGLNKFNSKIENIENGQYYVVIASERTKSRAEAVLKKLTDSKNFQVVQNAKGSWYHVIVAESFDMRSAIKRTFEIRKTNVKDAWWVIGRKLKGV